MSFQGLDALAGTDPDACANALEQLSPSAALGFAASALTSQLSFGDAVLNGPIFAGNTAKPVSCPV